MYIVRTNSTNTLLKELLARGEWREEAGRVITGFVRAGYQTAGRGQTGNGWESEEGKNLLCSILLDISRLHLPDMPFTINMAVCVALHRTVASLLSYGFAAIAPEEKAGKEVNLTIKWPNDIYYGDKKLAGILIENLLNGYDVQYSIAGIGLNVNQTTFVSGAPNPVSLKQITGFEYDLEVVMNKLLDELDKALSEDDREYYMAHLYRKDGCWPFAERAVSIAPTMNAVPGAEGQFMAHIEEVLPSGEIVLRDQQNQQRIYHFKQIQYVV